MTRLKDAVDQILEAQKRTKKPLAIIVAGHNGSGKSTMWRKVLSDKLRIPLLKADRMMLSILPEPDSSGALVEWAQQLRDTDLGWMQVAQAGVTAFAVQAMQAQVPFALETVFSHWVVQEDGTILSKLDTIRDLQKAGYFVILIFVGLRDAGLSVLRVQGRVSEHGHDVPRDRLKTRFPRTQLAISEAIKIADASILTDNSRDEKQAFTVCRVQVGSKAVFDIRQDAGSVPAVISEWLNKVSPVA